jgi:hypothetical protein
MDIFYLILKFHFLHLRRSNDVDSQPHITKFEFRFKFLAYCTQAGHLLSFFFNLPTEFFHFPIHLTISDFNASVYPPLHHSLIVWKQFFFHKQKDVKIFQQERFHKFRKEATNQVNSSPPSCQT